MLHPLTTVTYTEDSISRLKAHIEGLVLVPSNPHYEDARLAWNLAFDQHPAAIVIANHVDDVVEAVLFAHEEGLEIAVQATGHGISRGANDALMISMGNMTDVQIDAEAQTAWVQGGAIWKMVLEKSHVHGLTPMLGSSPNVGVVGYTLGGGMGWLARKFGLSADNVIEFQVVASNGQVLRVSRDENADLFWGLRGGGGSFGIVTGLRIKLQPVATIFGGNLLYPIEMAKAVITRFRAWTQHVPEEMTSSVALMNFPPVPDVPDFLRGKSFVMVRGGFVGKVEEGQRLLADWWLNWNAPIANMWAEMPISQIAGISNDPVDPMPGLSSGAWLRELSDEAIDTLIKYAVPTGQPPKLIFAEIRHAGGAIARVSKSESAYGNRDAQFSLQMVGIAPTPEVHQAVQQYISAFKAELQPALTGGVYMNFLEGKEKWDRTKDMYASENYQRLQALKAKYDPDSVFNRSFNIQPNKR